MRDLKVKVTLANLKNILTLFFTDNYGSSSWEKDKH